MLPPALNASKRGLKHRATSECVYHSFFGGPVLARGGSGDLLAGLIGGLMALTHCAEHRAPFTRPTGDADIAVSFFTHRRALHSVTMRLTKLGFSDDTPDRFGGGPQLSYRWTRSNVKLDVAVPPKINDLRHILPIAKTLMTTVH